MSPSATVHHAAPSYFTGNHHSSPVAHPKPGYGHASPSLNGGLAAPSYFAGVGGAPSHGDPDPWGGGGGHSPSAYGDTDPWGGYTPSGHGGGYASPSYFGGNPDPWTPSSYGQGHSPSAYAGHGGAPQAFGGYHGGHSNHRPKIGYQQGNPDTGSAPVQAPVNFRNPDTPTIVEGEPPVAFIPGSPPLRHSHPLLQHSRHPKVLLQ